MSPQLGWLLGLLSGPLVVDRIEGEFAVVEAPDGTVVDLPRDWFPADLSEGDRFSPPSPTPPLADAVAPAPAPSGAPNPHAALRHTTR